MAAAGVLNGCCCSPEDPPESMADSGQAGPIQHGGLQGAGALQEQGLFSGRQNELDSKYDAVNADSRE